MSERTIKCPICGEPYKVYMHYAGDQSACPACQVKAGGGKGFRARVSNSSND